MKQAGAPRREATRPPTDAPTAPVRLQAHESMVAARCRSAAGTSTGTSALRAAGQGGVARAGAQVEVPCSRRRTTATHLHQCLSTSPTWLVKAGGAELQRQQRVEEGRLGGAGRRRHKRQARHHRCVGCRRHHQHAHAVQPGRWRRWGREAGRGAPHESGETSYAGSVACPPGGSTGGGKAQAVHVNQASPHTCPPPRRTQAPAPARAGI